jgi:ribonucleotide reductase beta subunit family protein with ferritin-like domain
MSSFLETKACTVPKVIFFLCFLRSAKKQQKTGKHACYLFSLLEHKPTHAQVLEIVQEAVAIEKEFDCEALSVGLIGMNATLMCQYIECVADVLMIMLGFPPLYGTPNPFPWMELISLQGKTNFFERRVGEYSRGLTRSKEGVSAGGERVFNLNEEF